MSAKIPVQLSPSAPPDQIVVTELAREALNQRADELGYTTISALVRDVCGAATGRKGDLWTICRAAADEAHVPLGRWLRETLLAGLQMEDCDRIEGHKDLARAFVATRLRERALKPKPRKRKPRGQARGAK